MQHSNTPPLKVNHLQKNLYDLFFVVTLILIFLFVMLKSYGAGYKQFTDNFFQKKFLVENFNRLRIKLGDRVFPNALIGKNGWVEFTGNGNLDDYQHANNFSPETLQAVAQTIEDCHHYAQEHSITLLLVVAPNKASIYPDMLPDQIQPLSTLSRFDQLNNYLQAHNIPKILDLRTALREASRDKNTYYKLGTHWNEYGAYVAYETIMNALAQTNPALKPYPAEFFKFRSISPDTSYYKEDNGVAKLLQLNYLVPESTLFSTKNVDDLVYKLDFSDEKSDYHRISWILKSNLPSLLIFHDSFGNWGLNDFLGLNFSKATYINRNASTSYLNQSVIGQFSPHVLIYEIVERNLNIIQHDLAGCAQ